MHSDKEIKEWVCAHLDELVEEHCPPEENEFSAEVLIQDREGRAHRYTVFLELATFDDKTEWIVRNIVRPEHLQ
ncbi:hypothetical protein H8S90_22440 [Olivibacter sp. SDN3]|uniref:hypothetical protein n=1 Tax=Olivibacter sp. SDN3 TaxID=2764720 RepID=UPI0016519EAC|nr:hypothetical protein [Olivibacter sp. SDN3]QNL49455.1 hypothetical protein H8S90_22440 [Olivibacter sp. SDN3]